MTSIAKQMFKMGLKHDDHHATLKKYWKHFAGADLPKAELPALRDAIEAAGEAPEKQVVPWTLDRYHAEHPDRPHVVEVVETSERTGRPIRLQIECQGEGCAKRRAIASQDAFQVTLCRPHQREMAKARRRKGAKETDHG